MGSSLDSKTIFNEGLSRLRTNIDRRLYTTALPFARDLSSVLNAGIINDPPPDSAPKEPINIPSPKKQAIDMKFRKALAKRIIKAVQPQLETAIRAEAEIHNKPAENAIRDLDEILEASLQSRRDSVSMSMGEVVSLGDAEGDVEMTDVSEPKENGVKHANGDGDAEQQNEGESHHENKGRDQDVEMQDEDAPHEIDNDDAVAVVAIGDMEVPEDTIVTEPLAEVNGNISPSKGQVNGVKNTSTPPDSNGYVTASEAHQPAPPTPPISNGGKASDNADLNTGGVLWYLKEFRPEGTSIVDPHSSSFSEDLSDMDEEELKLLGSNVNGATEPIVEAVGTASASKPKKGKAKKRARANRW